MMAEDPPSHAPAASRRRRRLALVLVGGALAALSADAIVILAGHAGGAHADPLARARAAVAPHPDQIMHMRVDSVERTRGGPYHDLLEYWFGPHGEWRAIAHHQHNPLVYETSSAGGRVQLYDQATRTVYQPSHGVHATTRSFGPGLSELLTPGSARYVRQMARGGAREDEFALRSCRYYTAAATGAPLELDCSDLHTGIVTRERFLAYQYLAPTPASMALFDEHAQHPAARVSTSLRADAAVLARTARAATH
jgi:hypothetical protein